jgi:hypothetical protein
MKKTSNILLVVSILFMASCATKVKTKKYADINTNNFKTFACYASATSFNAEEFKTKSKQPIEESLISLINTKMSEKGFSVNDKEPDMVIFLTNSNDINSGKGDRDANSVTNRDGASAQGPNNASIVIQGYKRYSSAQDEIDRVPINNGALVVEIFSRETKELLWVGIARDFKSHITDQTLMSRMINGVFQDFPN